eukprot:766166-Amorphochlora_amoeboformis.AAC.1
MFCGMDMYKRCMIRLSVPWPCNHVTQPWEQQWAVYLELGFRFVFVSRAWRVPLASLSRGGNDDRLDFALPLAKSLPMLAWNL